MRNLRLLPVSFVLLAACAAQPGSYGPGSDTPDGSLQTKSEAVLAAECTADSDCGPSEQCQTIYCLVAPCPPAHCAVRREFSDAPDLAIPDHDAAGLERSFVVANPGATVASFHVSAEIRHTWRGDLRVTLTSPAGSEHVLANREGGSADDLTISADVATFDGERASGTWTMNVADLAAQDTGRLLSWGLSFSYGDAAEATNDVWTSVPAVIESHHPYGDGEDHEFDLRRYTGSASKVRLHFEQMDLESGYDDLDVVEQGTGRVLARYSGSYGAVTTAVFDTSDLALHLTSDGSVTRYGFRLTSLDVFGLGCLADADCGEGNYCPVVRECLVAPCFQDCASLPSSEEGAACASSADCAEGLYCAGDGTCRADGTCDAVDDCDAEGNVFVHILCVGHSSCNAGRCGYECGAPLLGGEGDSCGSSADCRDALYCAADGACHADASCTLPDDCYADGNAWIHVECAGTTQCNAGSCAVDCTPPPVCHDGETTTRDCNSCDCVGGAWRCTTRFCPALGGVGSTCGGIAGLRCGAGLVCDAGRGTGSCGMADRAGTCIVERSVCTEEIAPVCGCNGQTFSNDCHRAGLVDFDHDGECVLNTPIPDNDVAGVSTSIDARAPFASNVAQVTVDITHPWRGDLVVTLTAPDGRVFTLTRREGGSADDFHFAEAIDLGSASALGTWTLNAADLARYDVGTLTHFDVTPNARVCATPSCARPPAGCNYVGGDECSCGTLVCGDCRATGCGAGQSCQECRTTSGSIFTCMSSGSAC